MSTMTHSVLDAKYTVTVKQLMNRYATDIKTDSHLDILVTHIKQRFTDCQARWFKASPVACFAVLYLAEQIPERDFTKAAQQLLRLVQWYEEDEKVNLSDALGGYDLLLSQNSYVPTSQSSPAAQPQPVTLPTVGTGAAPVAQPAPPAFISTPTPNPTGAHYSSSSTGRTVPSAEDIYETLVKFMTAYASHVFDPVVRPYFGFQGWSREQIAWHVVNNNMYFTFIQFCSQHPTGGFRTASRFLKIPWSDGTLSRWTIWELRNILRDRQLKDLKVLVEEMKWDIGKDIPDLNQSAPLASAIVNKVNEDLIQTELLEACTRVWPNAQ
jgi:hypothetical protein